MEVRTEVEVHAWATYHLLWRKQCVNASDHDLVLDTSLVENVSSSASPCWLASCIICFMYYICVVVFDVKNPGGFVTDTAEILKGRNAQIADGG
jgi:hypothetical protein